MNDNSNIDQAIVDRMLNILTDFINGEYISTTEICQKYNIKKELLTVFAKTIKDSYPKTYEQYQIKVGKLKTIEKLNKDLKQLQDNKEKYIDYCNMLKAYILGNYKTPHEFSINNKSEKNAFRYFKDIIGRINPQIIEIYDEYYKREYLIDNPDLAMFSTILIDWLMNGIEVNGQKRKFDITDYFMATDIDISVLEVYLKKQNKLTINEIRVFGGFKQKIENLEKNTLPKQFFDNTMKAIIRNGQGELKVDNDEKFQIFKFIDANKLPVYTFYDVMNKYLNKEISLDKVYDKKVPTDFNENVLKGNKKLVVRINALLANDEYILNIDSEIKAKEDEINTIYRNNGITR